MTLPPFWRKAMLTAHIVTSVGWMGAVAGFLALAVTGLNNPDAAVVQAVYVAMELLTTFVIVPLAVASLVSGVVQSLLTPWRLWRHYWVVIKLVLTVISLVVLLLQVQSIRALALTATGAAWSPTSSLEARQSLIVHAAGGLVVLLVVTVLSVFKPKGQTPFVRQASAELRRP